MARFIDFIRGYGLGNQMVRDYEAAQDRERLTEIAQAKPEQSKGFTAEQGDQLRAAADSGQYDIGYDEARGGYTVTPKAGGETGVVAQQGVTDFLGQRTAGDLSARQVNDAKTAAMAGVLMRSDPGAAMRMQRDITQGQREDMRFEREQRNWARQDADQARADEYERGRQDLFAGSVFGNQQAEFAESLKSWRSAAKEYDAALARGVPESQLGPRPQQPARPAYTIAGSLADQAALLAHDAKYGRMNTQAFGEFTERLRKVEGEGYADALRAAASGAPLDAVAKRFNESGAMRFDPRAVISDQAITRPDGVKTRVLRLRDADGKEAEIDTIAELDALGKANDIFARHFNAEANRRANNADVRADNADLRASRADARAAASHGAAMADRTATRNDKTAKADAAVELYRERNPDATPAQLKAVRAGVLDALPATDKSDPSEVKLARAALAAKVPGVTDMASALTWARTSRDKAPSEVRAEIYGKALQANFGDAKRAREATEESMRYLYPEARPATQQSGQRPAAAKPASQSDAHRQAQAAIDAGADRTAVNARLRELGFDPLGAR